MPVAQNKPADHCAHCIAWAQRQVALGRRAWSYTILYALKSRDLPYPAQVEPIKIGFESGHDSGIYNRSSE